MTAIIKNNFRLRNARDFLENFVSHPRITALTQNSISGQKPFQNLVIDSSGDMSQESPGTATLTYTWDFDRLSGSTNNLNIKSEALTSLESQFGAHVEDRNHYLFVGKPTPWGTGSQTDELYPVDPNDTLEEEARIWDEMLGLKKIQEINASLVVPRHDWDNSKKTVYAIYNDRDPKLFEQPTKDRSDAEARKQPQQFAGSFYVMTDAFDVFICLENGGGVPSTQKPVRPSNVADLVNTSDGYVWKYITTIKQSDVVKFLTDSWMPIKTLGKNDKSSQWDVQQSAVSGTVLSFHVPSAKQGTGYNHTHTGKLTEITSAVVSGKSKARAKLTVLAGSTNTPSGDANAYVNWDLHITSGADQGAIYKIDSYDNVTKVITCDRDWNRDSGGAVKVIENVTYDILPRLIITTNGNPSYPVTGKPVVVDGKIKRVLLVQAGREATWAKVAVQTYSGTSAAEILPILSSVSGIGKDPEKDLGAYFVMLTSKLSYRMGGDKDTELDFPINNDYRQIGIIRNVKNFAGNLANEETLVATKRLKVIGVQNGPFREDEEIQATVSGKTVKAKIIDYVATENNSATITYIQNPLTGYGSFSGTTVQISGVDSAATAEISQIVDEEVKKFEGEILYLENRRPVLREKDQVEDIKTIIEF